MTALPIDPSGADLRPLWQEGGAPVITSEFEAAWLRIFQAGVEAERARAAAETTEEWGTKDLSTETIYDSSTEHLARAKAKRTGRKLMRRTADEWQEVQS